MGKAKSVLGQNLETFLGLISRVIHPMQGKKSWYKVLFLESVVRSFSIISPFELRTSLKVLN